MNRFRACVIVLALALTAACSRTDGEGPAIHEVWIPMEDGVRLAADIYFPDAQGGADLYPVLLEYLPYRKDESRARNYSLYKYFLDHGYAVARVDMRGTGNSGGVTIPYEYSDIELDDGEVVIDWLSRQEWSTGKVGMFGISWGGFNSIQMAMRNPPAMKAFVAVMATEYLYQEDVHYMDGIMHTDSWMMSNDLYNALPGAPDFIMDEEWLENRFNQKPSVYTYMRQQRDGPWWDRASAKGQYDKIRVPGFHIGGWYDGYRNSLPRMLEHVKTPVKAMIGPWDHYFPHNAWPEPQVEWRHEAVRWFDHFLKDIDTGILDEPKFAVYVRNYYPPDPQTERIPGRWRWEDGWPIERIEKQEWFAHANNELSTKTSELDTHTMDYKPSTGLEGERLCRRIKSQLGGENLRRRPRRAGDPGRWRRLQRHTQELCKRSRRHRAQRGLPAGDSTAFHKLGVSGGSQNSARDLKQHVAHALADAHAVYIDSANRWSNRRTYRVTCRSNR